MNNALLFAAAAASSSAAPSSTAATAATPGGSATLIGPGGAAAAALGQVNPFWVFVLVLGFPLLMLLLGEALRWLQRHQPVFVAPLAGAAAELAAAAANRSALFMLRLPQPRQPGRDPSGSAPRWG
jgi:hypothetical protein